MITPVDWGEAGVETFPLVLGLLFKIVVGKPRWGPPRLLPKKSLICCGIMSCCRTLEPKISHGKIVRRSEEIT